MKTLTLVTLSAVLVYTSFVEGAPEATCKEFVAGLTKKQLGGISGCSKSMKFKNPKEKAAKMNCILKCVLIKEKMLDENGQMLGDEGWAQFIDGLVPSNLMELAEPRLTKCKAALGPVDAGDEFCKSYDPLIKCMLDVIGSLCKSAT